MSTKYVTRSQLENYLAQFLQIDQFHDYCPNGLQVEGREHISRIITGVTANLALIQEAIKQQADAILVHHGYFWKNEQAVITHVKKQRLKLLLSHDINLFAYHLPLDAHAAVGNNIALSHHLGLGYIENFGEQGLLCRGELPKALPLSAFGDKIEACLKRKPLVLGNPEKLIKKVVWCTGGAQGYFHTVAKEEVDVYITGEASEFVTHLAQESGVAFIAAGHHATEKYGIKALGAHLHAQFNLVHIDVDIPNPV
jgi:dinuclear metal center YbgI/SA1388 family protein